MPKEKKKLGKKKKEVISQSLISTTWHNNESVRHSENVLGIMNEFLTSSPPPSLLLFSFPRLEFTRE